MADNRERDRMVFETSETLKRAIRLRAAMDGLKPAGVINAALQAYLGKEVALVQERRGESEASPDGRAGQQGRSRKKRHASEAEVQV